ncbi:MAG: hypothetical protein ABJF10_06415 [Chthoniobacter sp.]|uniref:hypothetical protein n=1 Tax=Chthoniobacter sp. TaxID=2510640 RepID=UPI0032A594C6
MNKPRLILATSLALLAGLASSLPIVGSEAMLTDDTTAIRTVPRAFYHPPRQLIGTYPAGNGSAEVCFDGNAVRIANKTRNNVPRR